MTSRLDLLAIAERAVAKAGDLDRLNDEHAAAKAHDHATCPRCLDPDVHGDQAPDPLEVEIDRLRLELREARARLQKSGDALDLAARRLLEPQGICDTIWLSTDPNGPCVTLYEFLLSAAIDARAEALKP